MKNWYTRPVFFVKDAESSIVFYRDRLGFKLNWNYEENGRAYVCQLSRNGLELILQEEKAKAGNGRVFIALNPDQETALRKEIAERGIDATDTRWGMPIISILDLDNNQLFFSLPGEDDKNSST
jgi:catechol 2,3-dioxygenase-like lactoylglutathione lyase family enzyme